MSSKSSKKNVAATKSTNAIITRNKSAQQSRQLRAKNKKPIKLIVTKAPQKAEVKSTNSSTATCQKDTPLQSKVMHLVQLVEQVEYYPDKLKRGVGPKKVFLKPKPNFKLVAATNKRKSVVPQKGAQNSSRLKDRGTNSSCTSEVSIADMVKLIEDNHSLSDEDFMEILTCPSPVWWEDPPDEGYFEDAICTRLPSPSPPVNKTQASNTEAQKDNSISIPINVTASLIDFESEIKEFEITPTNKNNSEKFNKKKQKLENILGNIKNVKHSVLKNNNKSPQNNKNDKNTLKPRKTENGNTSNNTDEEDLSDLSFNEEDILKNLENMDIPIEQTKEQNKSRKIEIDIQGTEIIKKKKLIKVSRSVLKSKRELIIPDVLPPLKRKPDIKVFNEIKSDYSENIDYNIDVVPQSNFRFISDDDLTLVESNSNANTISKEMKIVNISSSLGESSSLVDTYDTKDFALKTEQYEDSNITDSTDLNNDSSPKKVVNDLSEYITVYKIMSNDSDANEISNEITMKSPEMSSNNKFKNERGKLNSFFKKCKSNKRLKKSDASFPSISVKNIKDLRMEKENSDNSDKGQTNGSEENRLNECDYCVVETENGTKKFTCEKCEKAPIFACSSCNFSADTKELYKKHASNCKDVARITWENNYIMNQT